MKTLRSKILRIFMVETSVFFLVGLLLFALQINATNQYKQISDNLVTEHDLTASANNLIGEFNTFSTGSSSQGQTADASKITQTINHIHALYAKLDKSIIDPTSEAAYIGLKNTINSLVDEIQLGERNYKSGNYRASADFNDANQLFSYIGTDSNIFTEDELQYTTSIQSRVDRNYLESSLIAALIYLLTIVASIIYALRISKYIIRPIDRLTSVADTISSGNLQAVIAPELLKSQDETGKLSNAFQTMVNMLNHKISELDEEKTGVEKKVSERTVELNNEKARLEASINSLDIGFLMTDADRDVSLINQVAMQMLENGKADQDSQRQWTIDYINELLEKSMSFKDTLTKVYESGKPLRINEIGFKGRVFNIFLAPVSEQTGSEGKALILGVVVLFEDITEAKILERSKDEFFSIASHELRTPLTAIRGNTSLIKSYYGDLLKDKDLSEIIDDIHDSSVRLITIVSDFLDASRLEQRKMQYTFEAIHLDKIIEKVVYELAEVSRTKGVAIKFLNEKDDKLNDFPMVYADSNRIKQVVYNLLGNAMNYTDHGSISIKIELNDKFLKVLVSDTGRGMTAEAQQLLFHKFQQTGSSLLTRDTTRGTGLGLYISKLIIEQMNGSIKLESSQPNVGSTFSFTIPIATEEQIHSSPTEETIIRD